MRIYLYCLLLFLVSGGVCAQSEAQTAFSEGVRLLKAKKFVEAEKRFSIAVEKGEAPEGLKMSYIYKGFAFNGQGKYDLAVNCFDKAIEIDPLDPASYTDRALAYSYQKDYDNAIKDFNHVLTLDSIGSQAEAALYYLGRIHSSLFKYQEAITHYDKLLTLAPKDAEAYFLRGTIKSNLMDIDGSIADYDLAIKYRPDYMQAYANRGVQKVNKVPMEEKFAKKIKCLKDPCADLLKARELGDSTVDDMIYLYCKKCK